MIEIENVDVHGFEAAIRGMRNPMNSWDKSDSGFREEWDETGTSAYFYNIGDTDLKLMKQLVSAGSDHSKFMRFINVTCDITAPLYWWSEFDTYKVGTVRNSCSKMHTLHKRDLTMDDFSTDQLYDDERYALEDMISRINCNRQCFMDTRIKQDWWQMIQLLPQSFNQRATVQMNYAVLRNIYHARKSHKLNEWHDFCTWIKSDLPYSELITEDVDNG